jgi:membrane-associated phospholipid phosphatase
VGGVVPRVLDAAHGGHDDLAAPDDVMDAAVFRAVNWVADHTPWAHGPAAAFARYGIALFALLLVVSYLDGRRRRVTLTVAGTAWAAAAPLVALAVGQVIGHIVHRVRPYDALPGVHVLIARSADFSFPSDHATAAGAVAAGLLIANRRWGIVAAIAALLMAATRVYVGVHYPSDVLAGLALGALVAVGGAAVVVPALDRMARAAVRTRVRPLIASSPASRTTS